MSGRRVYWMISLGTVLEFYNFALYGFFAPLFADIFFPEVAQLSRFIMVFMVFASGFFARFLGGVLFGCIGDLWQRKDALGLSNLSH